MFNQIFCYIEQMTTCNCCINIQVLIKSQNSNAKMIFICFLEGLKFVHSLHYHYHHRRWFKYLFLYRVSQKGSINFIHFSVIILTEIEMIFSEIWIQYLSWKENHLCVCCKGKSILNVDFMVFREKILFCMRMQK